MTKTYGIFFIERERLEGEGVQVLPPGGGHHRRPLRRGEGPGHPGPPKTLQGPDLVRTEPRKSQNEQF